MKISVVIPVYNRRQFIERAVESVCKQSRQPDEVIIVDDGSEDGSGNLGAAVAERFKLPTKLLTQANKGVSAARNRGIGAASGDWIALLDSDDEWLPDKLASQVRFLEDHPSVRILQTDEKWIRDGEQIFPKPIHRKVSGWIFPEMLKLCLVSPSAVVIHRTVFDAVGLFDESLPACEDYDLWLRIGSRFEIHNLAEELVVKYGGHDDQLSRTVWGLDRFRIQSLLKIRDQVPLADDWRQLLNQELIRKCEIYIKGLEKRQKLDEVQFYRDVVDDTQDMLTGMVDS